MAQDGWADAAPPSYLLVVGPNGQFVRIFFDPLSGPIIEFQPPDRVGWVYTEAHLLIDDDASKPWLQIQSPGVDDDPGAGGPFASSNIYLYGESSFQPSQIQLAATQTIIDGKLRAETLVAYDIQQVSSAAIGNTETVILTAVDDSGNPFRYRANRAYRFEVEGTCNVSVANNPFLLRVRKTNAAGQQIQFTRVNPATTAFQAAFFGGGFIIGGADVTASMVLTLIGGATWTSTMPGSGNAVRGLRIYDDGLAADHVGWPTLV